MDTKEQIEHYRSRINEMLRKVPASVNGGSYDNAVAFKKVAARAMKVASSSSPKLAAITEAHNQLSSYY